MVFMLLSSMKRIVVVATELRDIQGLFASGGWNGSG